MNEKFEKMQQAKEDLQKAKREFSKAQAILFQRATEYELCVRALLSENNEEE